MRVSVVLDLRTHARSQVVTVCQDTADSLDETVRTDAIVIDFSEAFEFVPHDRLLTKISETGIDVSHAEYQMALLGDVMASSHPSNPSLFPLSLTYYPLLAQLSRDPPHSCGCLARKEKLTLCSLKRYPPGKVRLLASGEPISKFGFDRGLF
jgi:hypothetical protein